MIKNFITHFDQNLLPPKYWSNIDIGATSEEVRLYKDVGLVDELKRDPVFFSSDEDELECYFLIDLKKSNNNKFYTASGVGGKPSDIEDVWGVRSYSYVSTFRDSVADRTGNDNEPVINGNEGYGEAVIGKSFEFDGQTKLEFTDTDLLGVSGFTVNMVIKPEFEESDNNEKIIFSNTDTDKNQWVKLIISDDRKMLVRVKNSNGLVSEQRSFNIDSGSWYHISLAYNGLDRFSLFVNGEIRTFLTIDPATFYAQSNSFLGSGIDSADVYKFKGSVAEFATVKEQLNADYIFAESRNRITPQDFFES